MRILFIVILVFFAYRAAILILNTIKKEKENRKNQFNPKKESIEDWVKRTNSTENLEEK